jgi:ADP-ribosylglycohydrolase
MIGAIAGDIIGSVYESNPIKTKEFSLFHPRCRFTDDSVLTIAVAQAILTDGDYGHWVREIGRRYPHAGYGGAFVRWLHAGAPEPYNSWGNGSAMRVSPVGWAFDDIESILRESARTAEISHNHPEGIKGAQATAAAVFLARTTHDKALIKSEMTQRFGYDVNRKLKDIRPAYAFDVSCQGTVPEAIISFMEAESFEDAVRNAISLGGDSDTLACIAGAVAEAYYGPIDPHIVDKVRALLPVELWSITAKFRSKYGQWCPRQESNLRPTD